jgi:hypothetical protein
MPLDATVACETVTGAEKFIHGSAEYFFTVMLFHHTLCPARSAAEACRLMLARPWESPWRRRCLSLGYLAFVTGPAGSSAAPTFRRRLTARSERSGRSAFWRPPAYAGWPLSSSNRTRTACGEPGSSSTAVKRAASSGPFNALAPYQVADAVAGPGVTRCADLSGSGMPPPPPSRGTLIWKPMQGRKAGSRHPRAIGTAEKPLLHSNLG